MRTISFLIATFMTISAVRTSPTKKVDDLSDLGKRLQLSEPSAALDEHSYDDEPSPTDLVYLNNQALCKYAEGRVLRVFDAPADYKLGTKTAEGMSVVVLDKTIAYPQGGGQPSDQVLFMSKDREVEFESENIRLQHSGEVWHFGHFKPANSRLMRGEQIEQHVVEEKRNLHRRLHSAGHILALAVRELGIPVEESMHTETNPPSESGSHAPGTAHVEFKGLIPKELASEIENMANQIIQEDCRLSPIDYTCDSASDVNCLIPLPDLHPGKSMRLMNMGKHGAYPCGGTHCDSTGQIGRLVINKLAHKKGNTKISYDVQC